MNRFGCRASGQKRFDTVGVRSLKSAFLLLLFGALSTTLSAQDSSQSNIYLFNLQECIDYALNHQNDVRNARLDQQYATERIRENIGKLLPHASINGSFTDNLKMATTLIPDFSSGDMSHKIPVQFGNKYTSSVSGQVEQVIFNSNYFLGLRAARVLEDLSSRSLSATRVTTISNVSKAYYNVLVNQEGLEISQANMKQLSKSLKDIKAKYDAGFSETIDVYRIQVQYNNAATGIENQKRLVLYSLAQLKFQMGMPQKDSLELTEQAGDFTALATEYVDTLHYTIGDRPEYALQQTQILLDELQVKSNRLSYLPTLSTYINYGFNYFSSTFGDLYKKGYGNSAFGLSLNFPIFSGTERIHRTNQAKILLEQSQNDLENLAEQIHLDVEQAYITFMNNRASLATQQENMKLAQGVVDRVTYKFNQGVASSLDMLSAENELQRAQNDYIDALLNTLMSRVDLQKAMGKLDPER